MKEEKKKKDGTKKPFYKKLWFWLFTVSAVLNLMMAFIVYAFVEDKVTIEEKNSALVKKNKKLTKSNKSLKSAVTSLLVGDTDSDSDSSDSDSNDDGHKYEVGQEAALSNGTSKMLGLTLASATKSFNQHGQDLLNSAVDDSLAISNEKTVQLTFKYKNYDYDQSWYPSIFDFTVYDSDGNAGELINQQDGDDEVAKGRSSQTTFWANFDQDMPAGSKVEVDYQGQNLETPVTYTATVK